MKSTGIVRRLDDLGRIVIPKEIRKTMRMLAGDPIEIYVEKDELVLRKYSQMSYNLEIVEKVAKSLKNALNKSIIIADMENVICANGKANFLLGDKISKDGLNVIKDKKSFLISKSQNLKALNLTSNYQDKFSTQIIVPILSPDGEGVGFIAILDDDDSYRSDANDIKILKIASNILSLDNKGLWFSKAFNT